MAALPVIDRMSWCVLLCLVAAMPATAGTGLTVGTSLHQQDPLKELGIPVTRGAAAGYVPDSICESCHPDIFEAYQEVGMARSFFRPRADRIIEKLGEVFFHRPSQRYYQMTWSAGKLVFKRYELDGEGHPINLFEREVDWILGSGNKARTYLYQTGEGELFQLPLAWYTEKQAWGMAPGFDAAVHQGVQRRVPRECMFCHNAYPEVETGSDLYRSTPVFPREMPKGLGCQRCHGPGAGHLQAALADEPDESLVRNSIVNPAKLPTELRDDVCNTCHLQPSVALFGVRRFGRGDYSQRPGEPLSNYLVQMDVTEEGRSRGERFEINHHAYRLRQSRCFKASEGRLSCLTCHDPHRKIPPEERAEHFRRACSGCHQQTAELARLHDAVPKRQEDPKGEDCVACHMSKRRPSDVVQVVMTDHLIGRFPAPASALAPLEETTPVLTGAGVLDPEGLSPVEADLYRTLAVVRSLGQPAAVNHLEQLLSGFSGEHFEPWLDLARGQLVSGRLEESSATLRKVLGKWPDLIVPREFLAVALARMGKLEPAVAESRRILESSPTRAQSHFNLGLFLFQQGKVAEAKEHFKKAVELLSNLSLGWFYLGETSRVEGDLEEAIESYRRSLQVDPRDPRAYASLGATLLDADRQSEALRYLRHGLSKFPESSQIRQQLERASGN